MFGVLFLHLPTCLRHLYTRTFFLNILDYIPRTTFISDLHNELSIISRSVSGLATDSSCGVSGTILLKIHVGVFTSTNGRRRRSVTPYDTTRLQWVKYILVGVIAEHLWHDDNIRLVVADDLGPAWCEGICEYCLDLRHQSSFWRAGLFSFHWFFISAFAGWHDMRPRQWSNTICYHFISLRFGNG